MTESAMDRRSVTLCCHKLVPQLTAQGEAVRAAQELLSTPEPESGVFGARARSASDAAVLRRKGHLKEQDALIDFLLQVQQLMRSVLRCCSPATSAPNAAPPGTHHVDTRSPLSGWPPAAGLEVGSPFLGLTIPGDALHPRPVALRQMRSTHTCQEIFQKMDRWIVEHRQARAGREPGAAGARAAQRRALTACLWRGCRARGRRRRSTPAACARCSCMWGPSALGLPAALLARRARRRGARRAGPAAQPPQAHGARRRLLLHAAGADGRVPRVRRVLRAVAAALRAAQLCGAAPRAQHRAGGAPAP